MMKFMPLIHSIYFEIIHIQAQITTVTITEHKKNKKIFIFADEQHETA